MCVQDHYRGWGCCAVGHRQLNAPTWKWRIASSLMFHWPERHIALLVLKWDKEVKRHVSRRKKMRKSVNNSAGHWQRSLVGYSPCGHKESGVGLSNVLECVLSLISSLQEKGQCSGEQLRPWSQANPYQLCDLGQIISLSGPHFPQLSKVDDNSTYLMGLLWGLNKNVWEKSFRPELLKLVCASKQLRELGYLHFWSRSLPWGLRSCIPNKLPVMPMLLVHGPSLSSKDFRANGVQTW